MISSKSSKHHMTKSDMVANNNNNLYGSQIMNEIVELWAQLNQKEKTQCKYQANQIKNSIGILIQSSN